MRAIFRGNLAWGLYGLILGAAITLAGALLVMRAFLIQEQRSPFDLATTVQTITTNATQRGWKVSPVKSLEEVQGQPGEFTKPPAVVLELCHTGYAAEMLESERRSCLAMMPCTIAIYERGGRIYVSTLNRGMIGRFFRREAVGVMRQVRADEREILAFLSKH